jgi:hypothetical protein
MERMKLQCTPLLPSIFFTIYVQPNHGHKFHIAYLFTLPHFGESNFQSMHVNFIHNVILLSCSTTQLWVWFHVLKISNLESFHSEITCSSTLINSMTRTKIYKLRNKLHYFYSHPFICPFWCNCLTPSLFFIFE